jgi:hypothetical protein
MYSGKIAVPPGGGGIGEHTFIKNAKLCWVTNLSKCQISKRQMK